MEKQASATAWEAVGGFYSLLMHFCLSIFLQRACPYAAPCYKEQDGSYDLNPSDGGPWAQGEQHCHQGPPLFLWAFPRGHSLAVAIQESEWAGESPCITVRSSF